MPRYDYRCSVCGVIIEDSGGYSDVMKAKICCSSLCKGEQQIFHRTISGNPPTFILKGKCWAFDGYNRDSNKITHKMEEIK